MLASAVQSRADVTASLESQQGNFLWYLPRWERRFPKESSLRDRSVFRYPEAVNVKPTFKGKKPQNQHAGNWAQVSPMLEDSAEIPNSDAVSWDSLPR